MEKEITKEPTLSFGTAVKKVWSNMLNLSGRSRRSEFWYYILFIVILEVIISIIPSAIIPVEGQMAIELILWLSALSVGVRRIHDAGFNPIWLYINVASAVLLYAYYIGSGLSRELQTINIDPTLLYSYISNPLFILLNTIMFITFLIVFVITLLDSSLKENKYGYSPKYVVK